jgi:hypothetical protein
MLRGPNALRVLRIPSRTQSVTIVMPPVPLEDPLRRMPRLLQRALVHSI